MEMITVYAKILLRKLIRLLMRLLWILPVKKKRILFESFQGRSFSDNPREVWRYMRQRYGDRYEYICTLQHPDALTDQEGIHAVRYKSFLWVYAQMTSAVIVSNTLPITIFPRRKGQMFIETWHGGGAYKTLANDFRGYSPAKRKLITWNNRLLCDKIDVFLSSSGGFPMPGSCGLTDIPKTSALPACPATIFSSPHSAWRAPGKRFGSIMHCRGT